ncbi:MULTISPECIES: TonB-dependent siderophore receptor [unclassified Acinetobacter]|uniref:TonB-dependent siderophore receptor n=1 Tax=unclassified Acinetobacter TaxID=196816 RepID=UPI0035B718C5
MTSALSLRPLTLAVSTVLMTLSTIASAQTSATQQMDASNTAHSNQVQQKTHVLDTIYITAQGSKNQFNVITEDIKNQRTATDLRGLLINQSAVDFGGGNGTSQFVSIRGMGQNSIDMKIDNAYTDSQFLYHQGRFMVDPSLLKSVSVQKGAGAASAGIGATNGAIILKTVDAEDLLQNSQRDYGFKLGAGYSSNNNYSYNASVFGRAGNVDGILSYSTVNDKNYNAGQGYLSPNKDATVPYSALDKNSYLAKLGFNLDQHRFVLSHQNQINKGIRTVREEFTTFNSYADENTDRQAPVYREISQQLTNLEWSAKDWGMVSDATANAYVLKNKRYSANDEKCGYCGSIKGETTTQIETQGANLNLDWKVGEFTTLKTGVNYRHQEISPDRFIHKTVKLNNPEKTDIGAYVESISEVQDVTLTAGMRYDQFKFKAMDGKTVSNGQISPSIAAIWQVLPSLSLSANHNYATRSPRMYDALLSHGGRGITSIADRTKAEQARNTEIGFNLKHEFGDESQLEAKGNYFWQTINDAVVNPQDRHGAQGVKDIINGGKIKNHGYELDLSYRLNGLTAKVGVAQSNPEFYPNSNVTNELNPEFGAKIGRLWTSSLAYRFTQPNVEVGIRNRSAEKATGGFNQNFATPQNRKSYSTTDLFANWKPLNNDSVNVNFEVNNLANKFYLPHTQRAERSLPANGRDFRLAVNYTF